MTLLNLDALSNRTIKNKFFYDFVIISVKDNEPQMEPNSSLDQQSNRISPIFYLINVPEIYLEDILVERSQEFGILRDSEGF